jgi:hypothetical protein
VRRRGQAGRRAGVTRREQAGRRRESPTACRCHHSGTGRERTTASELVPKPGRHEKPCRPSLRSNDSREPSLSAWLCPTRERARRAPRRDRRQSRAVRRADCERGIMPRTVLCRIRLPGPTEQAQSTIVCGIIRAAGGSREGHREGDSALGAYAVARSLRWCAPWSRGQRADRYRSSRSTRGRARARSWSDPCRPGGGASRSCGAERAARDSF